MSRQAEVVYRVIVFRKEHGKIITHDIWEYSTLRAAVERAYRSKRDNASFSPSASGWTVPVSAIVDKGYNVWGDSSGKPIWDLPPGTVASFHKTKRMLTLPFTTRKARRSQPKHRKFRSHAKAGR